MAEHRYDPAAIEPKWQEVWARERTWEVSNDDVDERHKSYVLEMLPYPSGEPHMGHLKNYAVGDAVAHFHRRTGRRVLHPMGYDAFGLPAENNAIKTGVHPRDATSAPSTPTATGSTAGASPSTGRASSAPTSRATTAGPSGCSCASTSAGWPTAARPP